MNKISIEDFTILCECTDRHCAEIALRMALGVRKAATSLALKERGVSIPDIYKKVTNIKNPKKVSKEVAKNIVNDRTIEGLSAMQIAYKYGISLAYVYKVINAHK